jgi:hypothetical protein
VEGTKEVLADGTPDVPVDGKAGTLAEGTVGVVLVEGTAHRPVEELVGVPPARTAPPGNPLGSCPLEGIGEAALDLGA